MNRRAEQHSSNVHLLMDIPVVHSPIEIHSESETARESSQVFHGTPASEINGRLLGAAILYRRARRRQGGDDPLVQLREECGAVEVLKGGENAMQVGPPDGGRKIQ